MESESNSVRRVSVEDAQPRLKAVPQIQPLPNPSPPTSSNLDVVVAAFTGLAYALSARSLLLLSLVFSFVLALKAMDAGTMFGLYVFVAGAVFTVLPVAYLEARRRTPS
jgi:hypothetical protein